MTVNKHLLCEAYHTSCWGTKGRDSQTPGRDRYVQKWCLQRDKGSAGTGCVGSPGWHFTLPGQPELKASWQIAHLIPVLEDEFRWVCPLGKVRGYTTWRESMHKHTRVWYVWATEHFRVPTEQVNCVGPQNCYRSRATRLLTWTMKFGICAYCLSGDRLQKQLSWLGRRCYWHLLGRG